MVEEKRSKEWWVKFIAVGVFIISWAILIGIKIADKDTSLKYPLTVVIVLSIMSAIAFFGKFVYGKQTSKEDDIPEPIGEEGFMEIIKKEVEKRWNNLKIIKPVEQERSRTVNKNIIYARKVDMELDNESFIIIINGTYPKISPTILHPGTSDYNVLRAMNDISLNPTLEEKEERVETDLSSGKQVKYQRSSPIKKEVKKVEDVV